MNKIFLKTPLFKKLNIGFSKTIETSTETIQALIQKSQDIKLLFLILKGLQSTNNLKSKITMDKSVLTGVSIKLGLATEVSLKYK